MPTFFLKALYYVVILNRKLQNVVFTSLKKHRSSTTKTKGSILLYEP